MDWYALFVETGKENYVKSCLQLHFDKSVLYSFIPRKKITERKGGRLHHTIRTIFPGYVLIQTKMDNLVYNKIKSIPKTIKILGTGTPYSQIDEKEISIILKLVDSNDIIDYSKIYIENSVVFVKSGPLKGMEGIIFKIDKRKNRAKILVNFLAQMRTVDVGIEILEKAN